MNRDIFIRNLTGDRIELSPKGRNANELSVEEFEQNYEHFFEMIVSIRIGAPQTPQYFVFWSQ